jgi:F0F1-type ATP synthase assembly protein I
MDLALTVLVFLGLGWALDHWLGTKPVFMVSLVLLAVVGKFVSMYYSYEATMRGLEAERAAGVQRAPRATGAATAEAVVRDGRESAA